MSERCPCGNMNFSSDWERLELVGYQINGNGGFLELRDCICGSTRAKTISDEKMLKSVNAIIKSDISLVEQTAFSTLLARIGSWTDARFDQHLRHDFGDDVTDRILTWLEKNNIKVWIP